MEKEISLLVYIAPHSGCQTALSIAKGCPFCRLHGQHWAIRYPILEGVPLLVPQVMWFCRNGIVIQEHRKQVHPARCVFDCGYEQFWRMGGLEQRDLAGILQHPLRVLTCPLPLSHLNKLWLSVSLVATVPNPQKLCIPDETENRRAESRKPLYSCQRLCSVTG